MPNNNTKKLTLTALFAAMVCVATYLIKVPTPAVGGYIHLGDAFVILSGIILGPIGFLPAAVGSALADLISGYALYIPITFVVKGLIGFLVGIIWKKDIQKNYHYIVRCILCGILSTVIMVIGYLCFEIFLYGKAAFLNIPLNLIQGISGIVISTLSLPLVFKIFKIK